MTEGEPASYRAGLLREFAGELDRLYALAGRPEPAELDALGGGRGGVPLSPAAVADHMAGRAAPTWEFVATFVSACQAYAAAAGAEVPEDEFALDRWRQRYEKLLAALAEEPPPAPPAPDGRDARAAPSTLPPVPEPFVGREEELERLQSYVAGEGPHPWLIVLEGRAGIGKTTTAAALARRIAHLYPDGQLFVSLDAGGDPDVARERLGRLLRTLGVPEADLPESRSGLLGLLRTRMSEQRLLIVLDDVPDADVVEALAPAGDGAPSLLIVTSRDRLPAFDGLDGVASVRLGRLPETGVRQLLSRRLGAERLRNPAAVAGLLSSVGGLPLVLALLVSLLARSGGPTVTEIADSLRGAEEDEVVRDVVERSYAALSAPAATALRRLSLVDDHEEIPRQLVGFLARELDPEAVPGVIEELTAAHLVSPAGDGDVLRLHELIREFGRERAAAEDSAEEITAVRDRARRFFLLARGYRPRPEPSITRDFWTLHDRLSYAHYAAAIAEFVRHRQTLPPLTIGLKAPWGAGKTSLMRMIQNILDPRDGDEPCPIRLEGAPARGRVTNREVLRAADETPEGGPPGRLRAHPAADARQPAGEWRPTVWFNPWMYQNGEQIWAGLAHEIITQVTDRLPVADRERFWLRLNLARVDRSVIRRRSYRLVAERILPLLAVWAVVVVAGAVSLVLAELFGALRDAVRYVVAAVLGTGTLALLAGGVQRALSFLGGTAAGPLSALVRGADPLAGGQRLLADQMRTGFDQVVPDPGYAGRLGFLHLVQTDMKRVLDLIATPERPLVVFVDDLDRCSPGAVTQVIEAINLFLAGEFPHCVFVIGMEPGTVAAHVEVAYQDLVRAQRDGRLAGDWSTLGWRFLEKIVQLPLSIPPPRGGDDIAEYLRSLTATGTAAAGPAPGPRRAAAAMDEEGAAAGAGEPASTPADPARTGAAARPRPAGAPPAAADLALARPRAEDVDAIERNLRARRPTPDTLREMALAAQLDVLCVSGPLRPATLAAADRLISDLYSDVDAHAALEELLPVLASRNPREIKRFVNLFRFFSFIAERQRLLGAPMPEQRQIAKLAAFAIRWPHVISMLGAAETDSVLGGLERVAREHDAERWEEELRRRFPVFTPVPAPDPTQPDAPPPGWGDDLRAFLREGVEIAEVASRFV